MSFVGDYRLLEVAGVERLWASELPGLRAKRA